MNKFEKHMTMLRDNARNCVEGRKTYGGNWTMGTTFLAEDETRAMDQRLLAKVLSDIRMIDLDKKLNVSTPEKLAERAEMLNLIKEYLERRIEILNPKNW